MKKYIRLLRLFAKTSTMRPRTAKDWMAAIGIGIAVLMGLSSIMGGIYFVFYAIFSSNILAGMETQVISMFIVVVQLMSIVLGLRISYGLFGGARDLPFLMSLPISTSTVFAAKITGGYLGELASHAVFSGPMIAAYLYVNGTAMSWVSSIICLLLMPIIPMSISALLTIFSMRIFRKSNKGEMISTILVLVMSLGLSLGIQIVSRRAAEGSMDIESVNQVLDNMKGLISAARFFPPAVWAAQSITQPFGMGFWLFVMVNALFSAALIYAGGKMYANGSAAVVADTKKSVRRSAGNTRSGVLAALMRSEFRSLLRTPVYATNLLSIIIMGPFLMLVMRISSPLPESMGLLTGMDTLLFVILMGIMAFMSSSNMIIATSLSREGKAIWIPLTLPVSPTVQVVSRFLLSQIFSAASMIVIAAMAPFVVPVSFGLSMLAAFVTICASFLPAFIGAIPDLYRPKLGWSQEKEAVKSNINTLFGMLISFVILIPQGVGIVVAYFMLNSVSGIAAVSLAISAIEIACLFKLIPHVANNAFEKLRA